METYVGRAAECSEASGAVAGDGGALGVGSDGAAGRGLAWSSSVKYASKQLTGRHTVDVDGQAKDLSTEHGVQVRRGDRGHLAGGLHGDASQDVGLLNTGGDGALSPCACGEAGGGGEDAVKIDPGEGSGRGAGGESDDSEN